MKGSTLFGIVVGTISIFGAFLLEGGSFTTLWMIPALVIVFGGTIAAGLAGSSFEQFRKIPKLFALAFFPPTYDTQAIISQITQFASVARRDGILGLERRLDTVKHPFLKKLLQICIDGADPETLVASAETDIEFMTQRHLSNAQLFTKMGGYAPTMGIIGTVMGLISTLANAGDDPNKLIHHIASAFIATLWGIFSANIIWLPVGDKLRNLHNEEMQLFRIMIAGVHSVQLGETPTVIRAKLMSILPLSQQTRPIYKAESST